MERADSGLQRLAAACTNVNASAEGGGMAVMTGVGSKASRKRRRAAQANVVSTQAASVEEHLAALRARWQGLDRALEESQAQLAARASSVAAREAACAASERQLAARLAQLGLHERALQERAARVAALEHDVQARERALAANKENAVPLAGAGPMEACCHGADGSPAPARDAAADALATPVQVEARAAPPQPPLAAEPAAGPEPVAVDPMAMEPSPASAQPAAAPASPLLAEPAGGSEAGASSTTDERSPSCVSAPLQDRMGSGGDSDKDDPPYLPAKLRIKSHGHAPGALPGSHGGPKVLVRLPMQYAAPGYALGAAGGEPRGAVQPPLPIFKSEVGGEGGPAGGGTWPSGGGHKRGAPRASTVEAAATAGGGLAFSKTLDYKSCDHILCLTKDMARYLLPAVPVSAHTGGSTQVPVTVVDESGREWPMTYRCVPHRYSYELRAGWKPFAAFWGVSVGDRVTLAPAPDGSGRILISVTAQHSPRALPPSGADAARHASKAPVAGAHTGAHGGASATVRQWAGAAAKGLGGVEGHGQGLEGLPTGSRQGHHSQVARMPGEKEVQLLAAVAAMSEAENMAH